KKERFIITKKNKLFKTIRKKIETTSAD
ncbi:hypothetical protein HG1285_09811, partial [Hydrogenivirga sp. 128-5-R1-1]